MRGVRIVSGIAVVLLWLQSHSASSQSSDANTDVAPYLLFSTTARIYRMDLDGSNREELLFEQNKGILGLEYHYRLNLLFWTNVFDPSIKQANLNGSNIRTIVTNGPDDLALGYPVDLALDWINDKLYWTDRDEKIIGVYDLVTGERRVILSTGSTSIPFGLAIYPFPDYGWLYWVDRGKETLEVAAVTGEGREVLESGRRVGCAWPLTLDYSEHTIYWINYCDQRLLSINMDGSQRTLSIRVRNILFPYGISILNNTIFWTQHLSAFSVDKRQGESFTEVTVTFSNEGGARGIEAVHPLQQPAAEVFREIVDTGTAVCDPPCANGDCIDPGLCYCDRGWTGLDCLTDFDECVISNGGCDHNCTNLIGSHECSCREGYELGNDTRSCEDINECDTANGECEQRCINTPGSYECVCFEGFVFNENMTCEDVNECEHSNGDCEYNCTNSEGSYECTCPEELTIDADGRSCTCFAGFVLNDNVTCEDVNECEISNGGCDYNCTNTEGSYECSCRADFVLGADSRSCECNEGYATKDNITCEDVNECEISNGGCDYNCTNTEGSYECSCREDFVLGADGRSCECIEGYATRDNITCEDVNECNVSNGGCEHNCTNSEGSYECSCLPNFNLSPDGRCDDVNECLETNERCPQRCINLPGSYECGCFDGYIFNENRICEDVNECKNSNGGCVHNCANLEGSYECSCLEGFVLEIDGRSCQVESIAEISISPTRTAVSTPHPVETSPVLETSRLYTSTAATSTSSIVNIPQQSSAPSTVRTTQSIHPPSSTVSSSSSTRGISSSVPALRPLPTTTSTMPMLKSTVQLTQPLVSAVPTTSTTEASSTSSRSRTIPSSTSTTHTSPSVSMDASPEIDEPQDSSSTMLVIVAAAASAGVIAVAVVVMVIVAILVYRYRRRAHKSGSWSPPRSTADSPTDSIKYTSAVIATSVGDSKRTI